MKRQKLVRKYRWLKPNERIQWGDKIVYKDEPLDDHLVNSQSTVNEECGYHYYIGSTPKESCQDGFVRFVDCVPKLL